MCYIDQGILGCQPSLTPCAVRDGGWSAYGDWGPCSRRCYWPGEDSSGVRSRRRSCTRPTPDGGEGCSGEEEEEGRCELEQCGESLHPSLPPQGTPTPSSRGDGRTSTSPLWSSTAGSVMSPHFPWPSRATPTSSPEMTTLCHVEVVQARPGQARPPTYAGPWPPPAGRWGQWGT